MADVYTEVGIQIRLRRKERGMTLSSLAELSGLSPSYLGQIERDAKKASLLTLAAIAAALEVPVGSLFAAAKPLPSPQPLGKKIELALRESTRSERAILLASLKHLAAQLKKQR